MIVGSRASLSVLCQRVEAAQPRLPDGRRLGLRIALGCRLAISAH